MGSNKLLSHYVPEPNSAADLLIIGLLTDSHTYSSFYTLTSYATFGELVMILLSGVALVCRRGFEPPSAPFSSIISRLNIAQAPNRRSGQINVTSHLLEPLEVYIEDIKTTRERHFLWDF